MRFLVIVLLFCLAVAGSALLATVGWRGSVEAELERLSRDALDGAGFGGVQVEFDHMEGRLSGTVDRPEQIEEVLRHLGENVPGARWPAADEAGIGIRPTLPPRLRAARSEGSGEIRLEGVLSPLDEAARGLLGSRLRGVPGTERVENSIEFDPMVLPFAEIAEFASLATGLLAHPGAAELALAEGRLLVVGGVPNPGMRRGLVDLADAVGADEIDERIEVVAPPEPKRLAELSLRKSRFGVALSGVVPDAEALEALREALAAAGATLAPSSSVETAEDCGAAPWQEHFADACSALFAELRGNFVAEFSAQRIRVEGSTADAAARDRLLASLEPLRSGEKPPELALDVSVRAEGVGLSLTAQFGDGLLSLSGTLPDTELAAEIERRAVESVPDLVVKIDTETDPDAASPWAAGLPDFFAEILPRLVSGKMVLAEKGFELTGRTRAPSDRQILENLAVNLAPSGARVLNRLGHGAPSFPKPALVPEQRIRLAETLKATPVYFEKGAETLSNEGRAKVATLAEAIEAAGGDLKLRVTGFADNVGNRASNERLGLLRAERVKEELVRLGIAEESVSVDSVVEDVSGRPRSEHGKSRRAEVSLATPSLPDRPAPPAPVEER